MAWCCLSFWGGGIPNTTPTLPAKINDPNFVCAALKLCRLVSNQTSMMSICISCNLSTHRFCTEYLSEQSPVEEHLYIMPKDFTKDGKIGYRKVPAARKSKVMFCILCQCQWKAFKVSTQAKLMANDAKKKLWKSPDGVSTPKKKQKLSTASPAVLCELCPVAAFYSQIYIFIKVEKSKADYHFALIEEHFYCNPQKRIKDACEMLVEG